MLEVLGLQVRYGKSQAVFGVDLQVAGGELLTLLGRNGAGKTSTLAGIVGLLPGASGEVRVAGRDLTRQPSFRRTRGGLAYVPSGARCFPNLTVLENLQLTARPDGSGGWDLGRVFGLFPTLERLRANLAGGLSGGERQMLAVGRALISNPRAILLDEPTEGLAPVVVQGLADLLRQLKTTGIAVLLAEQNHRVALEVADRASFMEKGRIVADLPATEARDSPILHRVLGI